MSAGTIALTNNSTTVAGTGTSFTTELKIGDFVYVTVGGAPYTLVVSSVISNTQIALAVAFDGPTTSSLAWNSAPASLQVAITQKILNDFASVARGRILDFQNWQKIYSDSQSVTVTRPDRTQFTGPSWGYLANEFGNKADKDDVLLKTDNLASVSDKAAALGNLGGFARSGGPINGDVAINGFMAQSGGASFYNGAVAVDSGDLSAKNLSDAGGGYYNSAMVKAILATRGASGDARGAYFGMLSQELVNNKFSGVLVLNGFGANTLFEFRNNGSAYAPSQWVSTSDERIKTKIERIDDPLVKMRLIKGVTWERIDGMPPGIGFIAQDVQKAFPLAVSIYGDKILPNGTVLKDVLAPDTSGVAAALHHEAILTLMDKIEKQDTIIAELQSRMKAIDELDA